MRSQLGFLFIGFSLTVTACTNFQFNQTVQRFYDNMSGQLTSFTAATLVDSSNYSFSVHGDTHIGATGGNAMKRALQDSKNDGDSFAIIAGDITNTGLDSEFDSFNGQVGEVSFTVFPAIGNHDIFFDGWNRYKKKIGRSMYTVNAGTQTQIFFMDSANGVFGQEQLDWLRSELAASSKALKIVVTHFPLFVGEFSSIFKHASDEEVTLFKSIMQDYNVKLVLAGHYHGYADKTIGVTRYIVTGGCNNILDFGQISHYIKVTVTNLDISAQVKAL